MKDTSEDKLDRLVSVLSKILDHTANEAIVLAKLEEFFSPKPANLASSKEEAQAIERRLNLLSESLGRSPKIVVIPDTQGNGLPRYDTYFPAAMAEALANFHRCRSSVCRSHMFYIGAELIREHPEFLVDLAKEKDNVYKAAIARFWEHAETSYIRLASFWDRVGQLLDFVFFNIRQYERDGFSAVMDRLRSNFVLVYVQVANSEAWKHLKQYQDSEKPDGLKWLIRRRNLIVHSLHLRPTEDPEREDPIFASVYNHLDQSLRNKLRPGTPKQELEYMHSHLATAVSLFPEVIDLCEIGVRLNEVIK